MNGTISQCRRPSSIGSGFADDSNIYHSYKFNKVPKKEEVAEAGLVGHPKFGSQSCYGLGSTKLSCS